MSLAPHSIKRFSGLYGSSNPYSRIPEGACLVADNCVIRSSDVIEPRRGFKASASCNAPINALAFKQGVAVAITYDNPGAGVTGALRKYDPAADAWTSLSMPFLNGGLATGGVSLPVDRPGGSGHTRFVSTNQSLYLQGRYCQLKVSDATSASYLSAYQPPPFTGPGLVDGTTVGLYGLRVFSEDAFGAAPGTFLPNGFQVAYRFTFAHFGANGELIETAPSDRVIASNTSGHAQQVLVTSNSAGTPEPMVPPDAFLRIWRSKQSPNGTPPSDELFLVAEVINVGSQVYFGGGQPNSWFYDGFRYVVNGNGFFYIDISSDSFLSVPLYTNQQSGGTIAAANYPPPLAADMAWFRDRMYFLNTSGQQTATIRIIGTGAGGIVDGDSIAINGRRFRFLVSNTDSASTTTLYTAGTTTQNTENTARRLAVAIGFAFQKIADGSSHSWNEIVAYYLGSGDSTSGLLQISSVLPGVSPFTITTSSALGYDRDYSGGYASTPGAQVSGLSWSNQGEPEGVPLSNNTTVGDPTAAGQRIIALKETLFIFKQDGLWKATDDGSDIGPLIQPIDPTIKLIAPETAVALDNFILALCDQGVVLISETGAVVNITHTQIERELSALMARVGSTTLANLAFGVAYQPEHTYILSLPESPNATSCTRQYVYNLQTQAWSTFSIPGVLCGAVNPDTGQLYFGRTDGTVWIERKNHDSSDYQDPGFTIASPTASAVSSLVFAGDLRTGATAFAVGDLVQQFQATFAIRQRVVAVSYSSQANQTTVTLDAVPRHAWNQIVPLTIIKAIRCSLTFLPFSAGEPLQDKEWADAYLSFRYCDLDFITVSWTSEKYPIPGATNPATERINNADGSVAPVTLQPWGAGGWGTTLWGRHANDVILKATIPQDVQGFAAQLTLGLSLPCAYSRFELSAIDPKIAGQTDRVTR